MRVTTKPYTVNQFRKLVEFTRSMTTRLDPYTGQARPDLPTVDAVGYFNATAQGHYEVEGLAPGVYDLYASAAGYPQTLDSVRFHSVERAVFAFRWLPATWSSDSR